MVAAAKRDDAFAPELADQRFPDVAEGARCGHPAEGIVADRDERIDAAQRAGEAAAEDDRAGDITAGAFA